MKTLKSLPEETIILILEKACQRIVKDIVAPGWLRWCPEKEGRFVLFLSSFRSLNLVCCDFNRILRHCASVNGTRIRQLLLDKRWKDSCIIMRLLIW